MHARAMALDSHFLFLKPTHAIIIRLNYNLQEKENRALLFATFYVVKLYVYGGLL